MDFFIIKHACKNRHICFIFRVKMEKCALCSDITQQFTVNWGQRLAITHWKRDRERYNPESCWEIFSTTWIHVRFKVHLYCHFTVEDRVMKCSCSSFCAKQTKSVYTGKKNYSGKDNVGEKNTQTVQERNKECFYKEKQMYKDWFSKIKVGKSFS